MVCAWHCVSHHVHCSKSATILSGESDYGSCMSGHQHTWRWFSWWEVRFFFHYSPIQFFKTKFLFIQSTSDFYLICTLFTTNISSIYVVIFVYINWICQGIHLTGSITCCMRWKYFVLSCVQNHIRAYFVIVICYFLIFCSPHIRLSVLTSYRVFSLQSCPSDDRGPDTWRRSHAWWVEESHI